MTIQQFRSNLRFIIPQALTGLRGALGAAAFFAAFRGDLPLSAELIILGVVTDNLDGFLARRLKVLSEFGARFDYYTDYLCYVVVPAALSFTLAEASARPSSLLVLSLPLLTGAIRYSRNSGLALKEDFEKLGFPGLGTLFYGFFVIALVFLASNNSLSDEAVTGMLLFGVPVFSLLMLVPVRYPKMVGQRAVLLPVILGLNLMPFVLTRFLAGLTIAVIFLYTFLAPMLIRQNLATSRPVRPEPPQGRMTSPDGGPPCG